MTREAKAALGLLPVWLLVILLVAAPGSIDGLGDNPPSVIGLPLGIVVVAAALAVMAIGIAVLSRVSSTRATLVAFLGLTLPAAVVVVTAPAIVDALVLLISA